MAQSMYVKERDVMITAGHAQLRGNLTIPEQAQAIVAFVHGSGSSRFSSRNRAVAEALSQSGLATLLFDLLTEGEERIDQQTREHRFDIPLLARRLAGTIDWLRHREQTAHLPIGLFGASTGAAAALIAAAEQSSPEQESAAVRAVVSRGGRPDLAGDALGRVQVPVLLIVGGRDEPVIELNEQAAAALTCKHRIVIVPGATHLFEEPGALEQVASLAADWFGLHLVDRPTPSSPERP